MTTYTDSFGLQWTVYDTRRDGAETVLLIGPTIDFPNATWGVVRQVSGSRDRVENMYRDAARKEFSGPHETTIDDLVV